MQREVHFAPYSAIRYIGDEGKEFSTSLARPKPFLNHGDIVIVEKRTAFNLVNKGYGHFENVDRIVMYGDTEAMMKEIEELRAENVKLKEELADALNLLAENGSEDTANTEVNTTDAGSEDTAIKHPKKNNAKKAATAKSE